MTQIKSPCSQEEEAIAAKPPRPARGEAKVALKKQGNLDAVLAGVGSDDAEAYAATGIDSALDLMAALEVSPSGAGAGKTGIDRHPERRMKSAYASFEESELPRLKKENPTLRQSQIKQLLAKRFVSTPWRVRCGHHADVVDFYALSWKKSPLNPMNQATVAHNATAEEERDFAQALRDGVLESMKVND
jgi:hypothetical protein